MNRAAILSSPVRDLILDSAHRAPSSVSMAVTNRAPRNPDCQKLFKDGHINESVRKALEKYESYVQQKSALTKIGTDLMANAFNESSPAVKIADVSADRGKGLQMGFKFISMGAMSFWRNLCSHGDEDQMPHQDAIAVLATVSHLLHSIDRTP